MGSVEDQTATDDCLLGPLYIQIKGIIGVDEHESAFRFTFGGGLEENCGKGTGATVQKSRADNESVENFITLMTSCSRLRRHATS